MRPELPILIKARAKIADPANWGKGSRGQSRGWNTCCASEAIEDVTFVSKEGLARRRAALDAVAAAAKCNDVPLWNDAPERTHAQVLAAFDKAIASAS